MTEPVSPEVLFRLLWDGGFQPVGGPLEQGSSPQAILQFTPQTLRRLTEVLSKGAIEALTLVIEHAYRPGQPTVVEGWSARWLREHGMLKTTAEKAVAELESKGYIRSQRPEGTRSLIGATKNGVVLPGVLEDVEDVPGVVALNGRQWRAARAADALPSGLVNAQVAAVSADGRDQAGEAVDNTVSAEGRDREQGGDQAVSALGGDRASGLLRSAETEKENVQVGPGSALRRDHVSTPPTRSSQEEGKDLLPPGVGSGGALARTDLHRFLRSDGLRGHLVTRQDVAAGALAFTFASNREVARSALEFFGRDLLDREPSGAPEMDLAWWLIELLLLDGADLVGVGGALREHLQAAGTSVPKCSDDELVSGLVVTLAVAMDTTPRDWVRWVAGGLRREEWHQSASLTALLEGLDKAMRLHATGAVARDPRLVAAEQREALIPAAPAGSDEAASETAAVGAEAAVPVPDGGVQMPAAWAALPQEEYMARLREAVRDTIWEDDISFQTLLQNPGRQEMVLVRYEQRLKHA